VERTPHFIRNDIYELKTEKVKMIEDVNDNNFKR